MAVLFLAFANTRPPLENLKDEDAGIHGILARREAKNHFTILRESFAEREVIIGHLQDYRDHIVLFHFSGHAGGDGLMMEDGKGNAEGIAELLGSCPNLELVILNGCSTYDQVKKLRSLPNNPVVIATSAPIDDRAATQFSISFYQSFSEHHTHMEEAFQTAVNAARAVAKDPSAITYIRGFALPEEEEGDKALWGIYPAEGSEWRLPSSGAPGRQSEYKCNAYLIKHLMEKLGEGEQEGADDAEKTAVILKSFPSIISKQIQKLLVEEDGSGMEFFSKLGRPRLQQITYTFHIMLELQAFVMLAQIWDALITESEKPEKEKLTLSAGHREAILSYFHLSRRDLEEYSFFTLLRTLREIFEQNGLPHFIEEQKELIQAFSEKTEFYDACMFMDNAKRRLKDGKLSENEVDGLCIAAEEKLAFLLGAFSFLSRYELVSVKNIMVLKGRMALNPETNKKEQYKHHLVRLILRLGGVAPKEEDLDDALHNWSILLMKTKSARADFLNLTPFVIDKNAFLDKAKVDSLYYFERYDKILKAIYYRHIYKPEDDKLAVKPGSEYDVFKRQIEAFQNLLSEKANPVA